MWFAQPFPLVECGHLPYARARTRIAYESVILTSSAAVFDMYSYRDAEQQHDVGMKPLDTTETGDRWTVQQDEVRHEAHAR